MSRDAKILTVSDSVAAGLADDRSGAALAQLLEAQGFRIADRAVVADGTQAVASALRRLTEGFSGLVVTTGGTGFGPRDVTPEGTRLVIQREAPGIAEAMRLANPLGRLSRAIAGTVDQCLVVNTPGSPAGAVEAIQAVIDVVPHALELLAGRNPHPHGGRSSAEPSTQHHHGDHHH